ncbi:MAG: acetolactate decarboxylase [Pseudomonadota bacterium]|jgi:acetolactate decarboxylase
MQSIRLDLPEAIEEALVAHCNRSGDSIEHVIVRALADFLDLEHHSIYQVSTSGALVEGVYQGCVRVREILKQGDFGLGTFHGLDGEGILLDGTCYHALSDGSVHPADPDHLTPFWVATHFKADVEATFDQIEDWRDLLGRLDTLRPSDNIFAAIRIDGIFSRVHYRVACKAKSGTDLVSATQHQAEYCFEQIEGTLVGFFTPEYAHTINVPGYHLHFISRDRAHGGHVLDLAATSVKVAIDHENQLKLVLPESPSFLNADLSEDPREALEKAESKKRE